MKKNKMLKIFISLVVLIIILLINSIAFAAMEIIESPTSGYHRVSPSAAYDYCFNLRNNTSTLGVNTLDPHLALNADFTACGYLGLSSYGTSNKSGLYRSTSYNKYTASLYGNVADNDRIQSLKDNLSTKYVEDLTALTPKQEKDLFGYGWIGSAMADESYPTMTMGLGGSTYITMLDEYMAWNKQGLYATQFYRPAIWN